MLALRTWDLVLVTIAALSRRQVIHREVRKARTPVGSAFSSTKNSGEWFDGALPTWSGGVIPRKKNKPGAWRWKYVKSSAPVISSDSLTLPARRARASAASARSALRSFAVTG